MSKFHHLSTDGSRVTINDDDFSLILDGEIAGSWAKKLRYLSRKIEKSESCSTLVSSSEENGTRFPALSCCRCASKMLVLSFHREKLKRIIELLKEGKVPQIIPVLEQLAKNLEENNPKLIGEGSEVHQQRTLDRVTIED